MSYINKKELAAKDKLNNADLIIVSIMENYKAKEEEFIKRIAYVDTLIDMCSKNKKLQDELIKNREDIKGELMDLYKEIYELNDKVEDMKSQIYEEVYYGL